MLRCKQQRQKPNRQFIHSSSFGTRPIDGDSLLNILCKTTMQHIYILRPTGILVHHNPITKKCSYVQVWL